MDLVQQGFKMLTCSANNNNNNNFKNENCVSLYSKK